MVSETIPPLFLQCKENKKLKRKNCDKINRMIKYKEKKNCEIFLST